MGGCFLQPPIFFFVDGKFHCSKYLNYAIIEDGKPVRPF